MKLSEMARKPITHYSVIKRKLVFFYGGGSSQFTSFLLFPSTKRNKLSFNWMKSKNSWIVWLNLIKRYYNSMLKVISWYKLNHKWKTKTIEDWFWIEWLVMSLWNEMTFNPPAHSTNSHFISAHSLRMDELIEMELLTGIGRLRAAYQFTCELNGALQVLVAFFGFAAGGGYGRCSAMGSAKGKTSQTKHHQPNKRSELMKTKWKANQQWMELI